MQTSVARIWTHVPPIAAKMGNMLNIIHFHINDTSEEATIDQRWLTEKEAEYIFDGDIEKISFAEFKKDAMGSVLRYLILIFDSKVHAVVYNTGSSLELLKFAEYRVD